MTFTLMILPWPWWFYSWSCWWTPLHRLIPVECPSSHACQREHYIVKDSTTSSNTAVTALYCQRLYYIDKDSIILSKTVLYCQRLYYIVKDSIILSKTVLYLQRKHLTYCQRQHYIVKEHTIFWDNFIKCNLYINKNMRI